MKTIILSLVLVLFVSACSRKAATGTPQFSIAAGDVVGAASVEIVTGRVPSSPTQETAVVHLQFSSAKAAEFRQFTKDHLNQKVQILVGTKVVEEPVIRAEIPSPKIELMFSSSNEAQVVTDSLSKK
jgi:preprotein translocase subunit SecD